MISRLLAALAAAFLLAQPALALTDEERATVRAAEHYLQDIETLRADFVQQAPNGGVAEGELMLRRPGLIRFDYAPPSEILLVSDGALVSFIDYEVGQLSQWPLSDTPLSYLVRRDVDLFRDTMVDQVREEGNTIRFRVRDRDDPEQGAITFHFTTDPMTLRGWQLVDAQEQETQVALTDLSLNRELPRDAFRFDEPKAPWAPER
ncbi:MAG: hypothetical protein TEF_07095 [Rhizobiales bacterium NRL2]|nr:MAG: hypothetical protein TEF_07095 [Rhizobiales bacterium NRL2]